MLICHAKCEVWPGNGLNNIFRVLSQGVAFVGGRFESDIHFDKSMILNRVIIIFILLSLLSHPIRSPPGSVSGTGEGTMAVKEERRVGDRWVRLACQVGRVKYNFGKGQNPRN
jgi:hypothetical protein